MYLHQGSVDQQSVALPTERSEGGRERWERCRWQMKRPERVAAVGEGRRGSVPKDIRRAPQQ